jgi:superfamily I DNA/RNA helicase
MQERIAKLLAEPRQAKQLTVSTFHSLGVKILRQEAQALGLKEPLFDYGQRRLFFAGTGSGDHHRQAINPPHTDRCRCGKMR